MTDSVTGAVASGSEAKSNRLDPPHDLMLAGQEDDMATPWMAIAGRDPMASNDQLDRQTSELLAYVQQQNDEIDQRQAELNAKLAQLDNELRTARLRTARDAGVELVPPGSAPSNTVTATALPQADSGITPDKETNQSSKVPGEMQEFEEVEKLVAEFTATEDSPEATSKTAEPEQTAEPGSITSTLVEEVSEPKTEITSEQPTKDSATSLEVRLSKEKAKIEKQTRVRLDSAHVGDVPNTAATESAEIAETEIAETDQRAGSLPQHIEERKIGRTAADLDLQAMATSLDASELESERRLLAERKLELDRRATVLQRMKSETQAMHREALEMRLVTEQLWVQISEQGAPDHVQELLDDLQARLNKQYADQKKAVEDQANELVTLQAAIETKQDSLREQSNKLQQWVETRHDELKSYAAEVDARELLLDRREHRMREEFSKWEATRSAYQKQIQGLLEKLG